MELGLYTGLEMQTTLLCVSENRYMEEGSREGRREGRREDDQGIHKGSGVIYLCSLWHCGHIGIFQTFDAF